MNIHDQVADRVSTAETYAKDGAFYSAARCMAEAAAALMAHADGVTEAMFPDKKPPEFWERFDPVVEALKINQGDMLNALSRIGRKDNPGLMSFAEQVDTDDELEVDDNPLFSVGDSGVWVSAWVWVEGGDEGGDQ